MRQEVVIRSYDSRHVDLRVEIARTGVRQGDIASEVGISEGHLSHLLAGRKTLSDDLADRIAVAIAKLQEPAA
jgi:plasmid maintenance system antidote protein VapI